MPSTVIHSIPVRLSSSEDQTLAGFVVKIVSTCGAFAAECNLGSNEHLEIFNTYGLDATTRHVNIAVPASAFPAVQSLSVLRTDLSYALSLLLRLRVPSVPHTVSISAFWDYNHEQKILRVVIKSEAIQTLLSQFNQLPERVLRSLRGYSNISPRIALNDTIYSHPHRGLIAALNMAIHMQSGGRISIADVQHQYHSVFAAELYYGQSMSEFSLRDTEAWVRRGAEMANSANSEADIKIEFCAFGPDRFLYEIKANTQELTTAQRRVSKIQPSLADTLVDLLTDNEHGFLVQTLLREAGSLSMGYQSEDYETRCSTVQETATLLALFTKVFPSGEQVLLEKLDERLFADAVSFLASEARRDQARLISSQNTAPGMRP